MDDAPSQPGPTGKDSIGRFLLIGGASVMVAQVVALACGTGSQMLLARLLVPEQLAAYFLIQSVVEVGSVVANLGLPRPLTRFLAQAMGRGRPGEARGVLRSALPLWLGAGGLVACVYAGFLGDWLANSAFDSPVMATGTVLAAAWLVFQASGDLLAGVLRGFRKVGLAVWVSSTLARVLTVSVLLGWFLWWRRAELVPVLTLTASATLIGCVAALPSLRRQVAGVATEPFPHRVLLSSALPLLLTLVLQLSYIRVDLWSVGALFEADQVAVYGAVKRLMALISLPLLILALVVPPVVAELHAQRDVERLQRSLRGAATLAGLPALAILGVLCIWSEEILGLAFGPFFREGSWILVLLSIERLVFVWVGPSGMVLAMTGQERTLLAITAATGVLTLFTVLAGAHLYGFNGVAAGFVAGSTGQQLATWAAVRHKLGIRTDIDLANLRSAVDALRRAIRR